mmetsp:Transcript_11461/g.36259  ORF Transcript_11461/g.36259 Transcript_11461/m.36259 type:complete len:251 (+) Transcript_11461:266-1018(+)
MPTRRQSRRPLVRAIARGRNAPAHGGARRGAALLPAAPPAGVFSRERSLRLLARRVNAEAYLALSGVAHAPDALEQLVDDDDGRGEGEHERPIARRERHDGEDAREEGDVHDDEVEAKADGHRDEEPRVAPRRHLQQRAVLGKRVQRVQHLDRHEHGQRERARRRLALGEVGARLGRQVDTAKRRRLEVGPRRALAPVRELVEGNECVPVVGPVVEEVPVDKDTDSRKADINPDDHVPEEDPRRDELVVL